MSETLYHVELRHFPRNVCRFNLSAQELRASVLEPWVADRMFELGELSWDPRHARLTVLEGPRLDPTQLTMGRGWRAAERLGQDVTERLLAATREARGNGEGAAAGTVGGADAGRSAVGDRAGGLAADSLGLELLAQIGSNQIPLRRAWELAATRDPGAASDALALAERAVAALLRARLVVLLCAGPPETGAESTGPAEGHGRAGADLRLVGEEDTVTMLRALESWSGDRHDARVYLRRA